MYPKILIISPELYLFKGLFCWDYFQGGGGGGAYYWNEFCVSKWVGLDNKNSLKHYKNTKSLYSGGHIISRIFASDIWGAYFREGLFLGGLIIRILQ